MLLYRGLTSSPQGQTAASPLLSGTWVLLQRFQSMFDHEASDDFMLGPLTTSGLPPSAPLAPVMSTSDIGIPRIHYLTAGQTAATVSSCTARSAQRQRIA